ncbi:MAG TPA: 16S rRNA (uracil(1498)-N(3))-methyltransferase [Clostridia bacterium]|jgi:16S rRNA (uracil1498-N3)-methyltransferase|nr:16S rRNA (uracil(1498)-N(3))-methyltransferase [Clostridia bacterium]
MHRFFVPKEAINNGKVLIQGQEFAHLSRVLRLTIGDVVAVFDGVGHEYAGRITALRKNEALVEVQEKPAPSKESPLELWLVQGIPKGEKMELIIQKATELGVRGIIPLKTARCVVKLKGKEERRQRWQKIAVEAAKQCGRAFVPEVVTPCSIGEFLERLPQKRHFFVPWEEGGVSFKEVLMGQNTTRQEAIGQDLTGQDSIGQKATVQNEQKATGREVFAAPVYLVIGPEGGLAAEEVDRMKEYGAIPVTLGPRILRTETASLVSIALVMFAWGDLG